MSFKNDFYHSDTLEPHIGRTKEILKKHPDIKKLMGRNPNTAYFIMGIVAFQIGLAYVSSLSPWWVMVILAYCIGAFCNHALFTLLHECTHNLVFKKKTYNIIAGMLCDLPNGFPSSTSFRKYHILHHRNQGNFDLDADLPSQWEAKVIQNHTITKALWLLFYPVFQSLRPYRLKQIALFDKVTFLNIAVVLSFDVLVVYLWGYQALLYLVLCLFFSVGLHPLGARWIQEHYMVDEPQETYSYYGILNKVAFNVGYHNEHHDFMAVPWNRLPEIRKLAPEYYNTLNYHTSWSRLLLQFLFDKNISLYSRSVRP